MYVSRGRYPTKDNGRREESRRFYNVKNKSDRNRRYKKIERSGFKKSPSLRSRYLAPAAKFHRGRQYFGRREIKRKYDVIRKASHTRGVSGGRKVIRGRDKLQAYPSVESKFQKEFNPLHSRFEYNSFTEIPSMTPVNVAYKSKIMVPMASEGPKPDPVSCNIPDDSEEEEGEIINTDEDDGVSIIGDYDILSEVSSEEDFDDNGAGDTQGHDFDKGADDEEHMREATEEYAENHANLTRSIDVLLGGHELEGNVPLAQMAEEENYFSTKGSRSLKQIPMCFTMSGSTEAERNRIAAEMMRITMEHGGSIKDEDLRRYLSEKGVAIFLNHDEFINFLLFHEKHFEIYYLNDNTKHYYVKCKINLSLCQAYLAHANCDESCEDLHACKFHILSSCVNGRSCPHEHMIYNLQHNKRILGKHFLQKLSFTMLRRLLRDSTNRSVATVPKACSHYNYQNGCKNVESCQYLHICKYKIYGECKFGSSCKRSHDLFDRHNKKVLAKYGFDDGVDESLIGGLVREMHGSSLQSNASLDNRALASKLDTDSGWSLNRSGHYEIVEGIEDECKGDINIVEQHGRNDEEMETLVIPDEKSDISASCSQSPNRSSLYTWKIQTKANNKQLKLCQQETESIEHKYQQYLQSRFYVVQIEGERYTLDFATLSGRRDAGDTKEDNANDVIMKRLMKESDSFIPLESP